jgi:hypothetical protein
VTAEEGAGALSLIRDRIVQRQKEITDKKSSRDRMNISRKETLHIQRSEEHDQREKNRRNVNNMIKDNE